MKNLLRLYKSLTLFSLLLTLTNVGASSEIEIPLCDPPPFAHFDAKSFSDPTRIYNKWLPLIPGNRLVLEGRTNNGGVTLPHTVSFTVTNLTKVINGVRTVVVLDKDINEEQLVEGELAFFAQDDDGNVWNLGEYPEEFEAGQFIGAPRTWIAGQADAEAGVHMLERPRLGGQRYYLQGLSPDIDFKDCALVIDKGLKITVPFDSYKNVLVTDEISPLDPGRGSQQKYHAPGVGIIQIGAVGDPEAETLVLVRVEHLSNAELAKVRKEALSMDRRAYKVSEVYQHTPRAK